MILHTATLTVEEVYQDRDQFAQLVREVAGMDVGRMGIEILSFTIKVMQNHLKKSWRAHKIRLVIGYSLYSMSVWDTVM